MTNRNSAALPSAEGGRRPSGDDGNAAGKSLPRRFSAKLKTEIVLRFLRGEDLDLLSREYGTMAARISEWRDAFLSGGGEALKSRNEDARDREIKQLHEKPGAVTMDNELLERKIERMENGHPLQRRRPRK